LTTTCALIFLAVKLAFAIGIAGLALVYLTGLGAPQRRTKDLVFARWFAVPHRRVSGGTQPWLGASLALGQDDRRR
jgi:hypothetical protein